MCEWWQQSTVGAQHAMCESGLHRHKFIKSISRGPCLKPLLNHPNILTPPHCPCQKDEWAKLGNLLTKWCYFLLPTVKCLLTFHCINSSTTVSGSWDSVVGIETGYRLDNKGVRVRDPVGARIFLLHVVQTGCGVHPTSYPMGMNECIRGGLSRPLHRDLQWSIVLIQWVHGPVSLGVKRLGSESDYWPPASAEFK
jgi:hypothetical protein